LPGKLFVVAPKRAFISFFMRTDKAGVIFEIHFGVGMKTTCTGCAMPVNPIY
jgi:hypothetical protein